MDTIDRSSVIYFFLYNVLTDHVATKALSHSIALERDYNALSHSVALEHNHKG